MAEIKIDDAAVEIIAKKVLDLNMAGVHDSLESVKGDAIKEATEIAEKLIGENQEANKVEVAKLMENFVPKPQVTETPMLDSCKHFMAVQNGDFKTAEKYAEKINYGTTTAGGYFAPEEFSTDYMDLVNLDSNVMSNCGTPYPMKSNTMTLPTLTAGGNAYTVAEASSANSAALTASQMTTGYIQYTAYKHGVYQIITDELLDDSGPALEGLLKAAMVRQMATYVDWGVFHGNNTAGHDTSGSLLKGLEGNSVITSNLVDAGGAISFDDILAARAKCQNKTKGELMLFVNPSVQNAMCGIKDTSGRFVYNPDVRSGDTPTIWGHKVVVNNRISSTLGGGAESAAFFGGFKESALFGRKPEVRFIVDPYTYSESTSVKLTVSTRIAFEVASEDHFAMIHGITV